MWSDEVDRVLAQGRILLDGDLGADPIETIRSTRADFQAVEAKVSFLRRIIQGRLDIVEADRRRRREGGPADLHALVDDLPRILADGPRRGEGSGRLPASVLPPDDDALTAELEAAFGPEGAAGVPALDDSALDALITRLKALEAGASRRRQELFDGIDRLGSELVRRYRSGEASSLDQPNRQMSPAPSRTAP